MTSRMTAAGFFSSFGEEYGRIFSCYLQRVSEKRRYAACKGIHVVYVYASRWARMNEMEGTTHADDYG